MANNTAKIAALETAIASGVRSVSWNGVNTVFQSLAEMERTLQRLKREDDTVGGSQPPRIGTILLNGEL